MGGIQSEVQKVDRQLNLFSETLDEWVNTQKNWMYLESIFSAPDIQRQLPMEAKAFVMVDRQFKDIMKRTLDRPNALQAGTTPGDLHNGYTNINEVSSGNQICALQQCDTQ